VRLAARNDILMGSQRFITLIQGTAVGDIDLGTGKPAGVIPTADEASKVFISAGKLEVSADNKVVQQNVAPLGVGQAVGLYLTGASNPAIIIDPPRIVELWGAFSSNGQVRTGADAAQAIPFQVVDANGAPIPTPAGANFRFNSCTFGTTSCTAPNGGAFGGGATGGDGGGGGGDVNFVSQINAGVLTARDGLGGGPGGPGGDPHGASQDSQTSAEEGAAQVESAAALTTPPVVLSVAPVDPDQIVVDPVVTGTGSEEIWRQRRQKQ